MSKHRIGSRDETHSGYAYHPALDGVRAVAVAAVLLFHGGVALLPGGFLGVDAFFVLSGFLITSLLLAEQDRDGRIRLVAFWSRRARRLLPALLVVLVVSVVGARFLLPPDARLRWDALAALGYVANWRMIFQGGGYFDQTATPSVLQHTWSLGIEEQFYLIWPVLLLAVPRRFLAAACVLGVLASAVTAGLLYQPFDVNRAYYGTDTRAQALLVGGALAAWLATRPVPPAAGAHPAGGRVGGRRAGGHPVGARPAARRSTGRRFTGGVAVVGAAGFVLAVLRASGADGWLYRGGFLAVAVAVAGVIAHLVLHPRSALAQALAMPPLIWLGKVSYGVYLWHWPLFQFLNAERTGLTGPALLVTRVAVTIGVAAASYVLVERPIRNGFSKPGLRPVPGTALSPVRLVPAAALSAVVGVVAVVLAATTTVRDAPPVPTALPAAAPAAPQAAAALPAPAGKAGRGPGAAQRVTFFGDSVSWTLGTYWPATTGLDVTVRAVQGCGIATLPDIMQLGTPHTNYPGCTRWQARWQAGVDKDHPDIAVILLDRWELMDRRLNGRWTHVGEPDYNAYLAGQLRIAIGIAGSRGARVVLLTAPYTRRVERPDGGLYPEDQPDRVDQWNALLRQVAAGLAQPPTVLDLNRRACPQGAFTWSINGLRIRSDGLHFTPAGVQRWIAPWLAPQLVAAGAGSEGGHLPRRVRSPP